MMSTVLKRVTTEFVAAEDRIRVAGLTEDEQKVVLWLTRRMLGLLLPVLLQQLDAQFAAQSPEHRATLQEFAQQAARETLEPTERVAADAQAEALLVTSVDVGPMEQGTLLTFRNEVDKSYRLPLPGEALRQWMHILYQADCDGNWKLPQWPDWLTGESKLDFDFNAALH
jgi:hypothetical protein